MSSKVFGREGDSVAVKSVKTESNHFSSLVISSTLEEGGQGEEKDEVIIIDEEGKEDLSSPPRPLLLKLLFMMLLLGCASKFQKGFETCGSNLMGWRIGIV
jgi:hypothetical protein